MLNKKKLVVSGLYLAVLPYIAAGQIHDSPGPISMYAELSLNKFEILDIVVTETFVYH